MVRCAQTCGIRSIRDQSQGSQMHTWQGSLDGGPIFDKSITLQSGMRELHLEVVVWHPATHRPCYTQAMLCTGKDGTVKCCSYHDSQPASRQDKLVCDYGRVPRGKSKRDDVKSPLTPSTLQYFVTLMHAITAAAALPATNKAAGNPGSGKPCLDSHCPAQ